MKLFVLDTSVAASWAFPDESSALAGFAFDAMRDGAVALVPALWWFELRNTLLVGERRSRLTSDHTVAFLDALTGFDIRIQPVPHGSEPILPFARKHRLTVYDAAYLALAVAERAPLATLDAALLAAAKAEGVERFN